MKCSFTTLGCPDWSFEKILSEAQRMGFDGIEIRGLEGEMLADKIEYFKPGKQQDTLRRLQQHQLEMTGFGTSVNFHDPAKTPGLIEDGKAAIDVCERMHIPAIRVFGDKIVDPAHEQQIIDQVVAGIKTLCDYAEGTSVQVWLEVHGNFNTLERVQAVVDRVPSERFGVLWDIEHSDKIYGDYFMAFYGPLKPAIRHVHVKDHVRADGAFQLCRLGEGDIPIRKIVDQMLRDGYDGYFSLEWEKKWHPELPDAEIAFPDFIRIMKP